MSYVNLPRKGGGTPSGGQAGNEQLQFNNNGQFGGDPSLKWDSAENALVLNGLALKALSGTYSLVDDVTSPAIFYTYDANDFKHSIFEYSLVRNGEYRTGVIIVANSLTTAKIHDSSVDTVDLGVNFDIVMTGSTVQIQYTTTATGHNAFMRFAARQW